VLKVDDAKEILRELGMPRPQRNANAAYKGDQDEPSWRDRIRTAKIRKNYAENTRETIRRQAIHQFVQGGILERNPDDPDLATNSPKTHYALTDEALEVLRAYGTRRFQETAAKFRSDAGGGLAERYAKRRSHAKIPVVLPDGGEASLSPGKHNQLQRDVVADFLPRFGGGAVLLYLGDAEDKTLYVDREGLKAIGVVLTKHDKLPDVVAHDPLRNWLFLIEAVTSHGPVTPKRQAELAKTLEGCDAGKIYVSAFPDFKEFRRHAEQIAWETEVWFSDSPGHLLHYNGDRFFGPRS